MEKLLNFFKKPGIATFVTVLSGSLLLLIYWFPGVTFGDGAERFAQHDLWKSAFITLLYFIGLRVSVQKRSYSLLYLLVLIITLILFLPSFILTSDNPPSGWKSFLRDTLYLAALLLPPLGIVSAILVWLLSRLKRVNKRWYYLKAGLIGAVLGAVAAALSLCNFGVFRSLLCLWRHQCSDS